MKTELEPSLRDLLPADGSIVFSGISGQLQNTMATFRDGLIGAFVLLCFLLALLLSSFRDASIVVSTVPLAAFGSVVVLRILDFAVGQTLDIITIIGFVISMGLIVNNAILLVYGTRTFERQGMASIDALRTTLEHRIQPILITTSTSIVGMLPLLLAPSESATVYRGLAGVIIGGMVSSTLVSLVLIPILLLIRKGSTVDV